jgi:hypothetical protein
LKTIIACVKVQNESDIIESLCRYYCSFCDGITVIDNRSTDNTKDIVLSLIKEGLPVYLLDDIDLRLPSVEIRTKQFHIAVDRYNADIVIPIDADEFLTSANGGNPRPILESLEENIEYSIQRHNYKCPKSLEDNTQFFPSYSNQYSVVKPIPKVLITRYLLKEKNARPYLGAHWLVFSGSTEYPSKRELKELVYAHYGIRNESQLMTKIIPGWLLNACWPGRDYTWRVYLAWRWKKLYNELKTKGSISPEELELYSLLPDMSNFTDNEEAYKTLTKEFDVSFCNNKLTLRYTDYSANKKYLMQIILKTLEENLMNLPSFRIPLEREIAQEQYLQNINTIDALSRQISALNKDVLTANNVIVALNEIISNTKNSVSWKIGNALVRFIKIWAKPFRKRAK